jgi:hypothetical protein
MKKIPSAEPAVVASLAEKKKAPRHPLNPDRLAKIQIEAVSTIAATIRHDSPHESIRKAYELLDIAASAQAFLERNDQQSFEAGIDHHHTITEQKREFEKNRLAVSFEVDSEGNRLNVPWETLIKNLYPDGRKVKRDEREFRLKKFICAIEGIDDKDLIEKGGRLEQLQKVGVAPALARTISVCFHNWYEKAKRETKAVSGSKGGNAEKKPRRSRAKQGRVRSQSDQRLKSRKIEKGISNDPDLGEPHLQLLKAVLTPAKRET